MPISFAYPVYIWLPAGLAAMALAYFGLRWLERRRGDRMNRFIEAALAPRLLLGYTTRIRRPLHWFAVAGCGFLALALAQPFWGESWQTVSKQSRDVLVLLDTSESMNAEDTAPNRLARAKFKIESLLEAMPADRFGLIAFSGGAVLQCPLTVDHGYFRTVLDAVDTDSLSLEGTDIEAALREAVKTFANPEERGADFERDHQAILLISDGEAVEGNALEAAEAAADVARIYVMGIGNPNGSEVEVPAWVRRYGAGGTQETHLSKLDEDALIEIARTGSGRYVRSVADNFDVEKIQEFMGEVAAQMQSSDMRLRLVNRYQWPLLAAFLCFAAEGAWWAAMPFIRRWRLRRGAGAAAQGDAQHA